jgi:predicted metal-binding membrane protein
VTRGMRGPARSTGSLLAVSAVAWALLLLRPHGLALPVYCSLPSGAAMPRPSLDLLLWLNPPVSLATAWALMLAAMMLPLLTFHVRALHERTFARRRARALLLFITGYAAVWMAAGAVVLAIVLAVRLSAGETVLPASFALAAAVAWQCSPLKQRCLNRAHFAPALRAFGLAADVDVLRFGLAHGAWCVASCWILMLVSLLLPEPHIAGMAAVAVWLFAERLEIPRAPRWQLRVPRKAVRIVVAPLRAAIQQPVRASAR